MAAKKQIIGPSIEAQAALDLTISGPVSAIVVAGMNLTAIIVQAIESRYERMDEADRKRADNLLLNAGERTDQGMAWIHKRIMGLIGETDTK